MEEQLHVAIHAPTSTATVLINTLRPRQNGRRFADDTFKRIFLNENARIPIKIALKFVPKGAINNNPALVQIMVWRRSGDKPLSEPMMVSLLTQICVTRPQWAKIPWNISMDEQFSVDAMNYSCSIIVKLSSVGKIVRPNFRLSSSKTKMCWIIPKLYNTMFLVVTYDSTVPQRASVWVAIEMH